MFVTHDIDEAVYLSDRVAVMSSNPGTIIGDIAISLGRPRHPLETRSHPDFSSARNQIWGLLHAEAHVGESTGKVMVPSGSRLLADGAASREDMGGGTW